MPLTKTSPSSAIRTVVPGIGRPTDPTRVIPGMFRVAGAVVSVRP